MDRTIVITGASSGIGLATALKLAASGTNLVLVARGRQSLDDAARQLRARGANVSVLVADMGNEAEVYKISQQLLITHGRFDVWINCASVAAYGSFLSISSEQFNKVVQTNVIGYVNGSRAALRHFYSRQDGGMLINIASGFGVFPGPYTSPYVTSKYAVRGLSAALRQELLHEKRNNIKVCTVLPATIDTPFYRHTANLSGKEVKALQPVYPASDVAEAIARLLDRPKSEVVVGGAARLPKLLYGLAPQLTERIMTYYVTRKNYKKIPSAETEGNLFQSQHRKAEVSGDWDVSSSKRLTKAVVVASIVVVIIGIFSKGKKGK